MINYNMNNNTPDLQEKKPVLEVENLSRDYWMGTAVLAVLKNVSLKVFAGETVAIVGASGAGKSTLLHIIGGLDQPTRGAVRFHGRDIYALSGRQRTVLRARRVGFVFQFYHLLPELDVLENVMLPAMNSRLGLFGFSYPADRNFPPQADPSAADKKVRQGIPLSAIAPCATADAGPPVQPRQTMTRSSPRARALNLLQSVGLIERAGHLPAELSGGEHQRVAVARALINEPELLLADEPTGNLDSVTGAQVLNVLFGLVRNKRRTLLLVTHNAEIAARCDRILKLQDGSLLVA